MLEHFLDFRFEVVTKRASSTSCEQLRRRIHILEGFENIFDALDETIRIIRRSEGKQDAAQKLMKRFGLDDEQVDAILELKLYRLAKLEILHHPRGARPTSRAEAKRIEKLLASKAKLLGRGHATSCGEVAAELRRRRGGPRSSADVEELEFDGRGLHRRRGRQRGAVTRDGWIKRQRELKDPDDAPGCARATR